MARHRRSRIKDASQIDIPLPAARFLAPEIFKPRWAQFRVPHRMLDVLVPQVSLQRARVMPPVCKRIAARMAQHVRMHTELEPGLDASPRDHLGETRRGERCAPLRHEQER